MGSGTGIDRRRQILDATVDIIATEGMAKATNRRIAERAGIPLGHLTYHFASKNDLLLGATERINEVLDRSFEGIGDPTDLGDSLERMTRATWAWMTRDPEFQIAVIEMSIWNARQNTGAPPDVYRRTIDYLSNLALETVPPLQRAGIRDRVAQAVSVFIGALDGLFLQRLTNPDGPYDAGIDVVAATAREAGARILTLV